MGQSPFGPFTKFIYQIVMEKLRTEWSINNPTAESATPSTGEKQDQTRLRFGLEWTPGSIEKVYEIHVVGSSAVPTGERSEGYRMEAFFETIHIHIFVRRDDITMPSQALNIINEVKRIMKEFRTSFGQGIQHIDPVSLDEAHDPSDYRDDAYWHWDWTFQAHYFTAHT